MTGIHEIEIKQTFGYWTVMINGEFFCSADTYMEAVEEIEKVYK